MQIEALLERMGMAIGEDHLALGRGVRQFAQGQLAAGAAERDRTAEYPQDLLKSLIKLSQKRRLFFIQNSIMSYLMKKLRKESLCSRILKNGCLRFGNLKVDRQLCVQLVCRFI